MSHDITFACLRNLPSAVLFLMILAAICHHPKNFHTHFSKITQTFSSHFLPISISSPSRSSATIRGPQNYTSRTYIPYLIISVMN
ncbi:unnamed protein product [Allacma fusca]|uniref:Uncharacterized protein n=1 Tax=Allacma fusca TaxID=39272 RepID=A0A8J2KKQ4_9HEXA|nr:unnamed protein product [Allacma fusca]